MKTLIAIAGFLACLPAWAENPVEQHRQAAAKVADLQDELSADVQQLTIEQTVPQVIELLNQVKTVMDEATDQLAASDTGGKTIAAQTEVIEKIHAAAKEKQKQPGSGQSGGAMMDMMERMMGKKPESLQPGNDQKGDSGDQAGMGGKGDSNAENVNSNGPLSGKDDTRRVPKASGNAGRVLPEEFQQALDAYNRGAAIQLK